MLGTCHEDARGRHYRRQNPNSDVAAPRNPPRGISSGGTSPGAFGPVVLGNCSDGGLLSAAAAAEEEGEGVLLLVVSGLHCVAGDAGRLWKFDEEDAPVGVVVVVVRGNIPGVAVV